MEKIVESSVGECAPLKTVREDLVSSRNTSRRVSPSLRVCVCVCHHRISQNRDPVSSDPFPCVSPFHVWFPVFTFRRRTMEKKNHAFIYSSASISSAGSYWQWLICKNGALIYTRTRDWLTCVVIDETIIDRSVIYCTLAEWVFFFRLCFFVLIYSGGRPRVPVAGR